jgi:hypothetical protein
LPEIEHEGLPRGLKMESVGDGQFAVGFAIVLTESKEGDVRRKEVNRLLDVVMQFDLDGDGVCFKVDQSSCCIVLGSRHRPAVQVDDEIGRVIQIIELILSQTIAATVRVQRVKSPMILQIKTPHYAVNEFRRGWNCRLPRAQSGD